MIDPRAMFDGPHNERPSRVYYDPEDSGQGESPIKWCKHCGNPYNTDEFPNYCPYCGPDDDYGSEEG